MVDFRLALARINVVKILFTYIFNCTRPRLYIFIHTLLHKIISYALFVKTFPFISFKFCSIFTDVDASFITTSSKSAHNEQIFLLGLLISGSTGSMSLLLKFSILEILALTIALKFFDVRGFASFC